jgi:hypothetical protein
MTATMLVLLVLHREVKLTELVDVVRVGALG